MYIVVVEPLSFGKVKQVPDWSDSFKGFSLSLSWL